MKVDYDFGTYCCVINSEVEAAEVVETLKKLGFSQNPSGFRHGGSTNYDRHTLFLKGDNIRYGEGRTYCFITAGDCSNGGGERVDFEDFESLLNKLTNKITCGEQIATAHNWFCETTRVSKGDNTGIIGKVVGWGIYMNDRVVAKNGRVHLSPSIMSEANENKNGFCVFVTIQCVADILLSYPVFEMEEYGPPLEIGQRWRYTKYEDKNDYILAMVGWDTSKDQELYALINLDDGNRFTPNYVYNMEEAFNGRFKDFKLIEE